MEEGASKDAPFFAWNRRPVRKREQMTGYHQSIQTERRLKGGWDGMLILAALTGFCLPLYVIFGLAKRYM